MEINHKFKLFTMSRPKDIGENYSVSKGLRYKTCNYFHKGVANGCICLHNLITGQVFWKCILKRFCFELIYDKLSTTRCVCSVSTTALRYYVNNGLLRFLWTENRNCKQLPVYDINISLFSQELHISLTPNFFFKMIKFSIIFLIILFSKNIQ